MSEPVLAWHFLRADRNTRFSPIEHVEPGRKLTVRPPLVMCKRGLHASIRPIDALRFAPGPIVCRVALSGEILTGPDKACATERTCIWMADATRTLHEFACWCAEQALQNERDMGRPIDPRSLAAIAIKRRWLAGEATDTEMEGAIYDAADAYEDVAGSTAAFAASAAVSAARTYAADAARTAADAAANVARTEAYAVAHACSVAAGTAADAAGTAARTAAASATAAARDAQNSKLEEMLMLLDPKECPK